MRKITIAALTTLMLGTAQAEYIIKTPLEQSQGGSLPNGSIQLGKTAPPVKPFDGCVFSEGDNASFWALEPAYTLKEIYWNGQRLTRMDSTTDQWLNPEEIDGYVYRPGDYVKTVKRAEPNWDGSDFYIDYYYVCRENI